MNFALLMQIGIQLIAAMPSIEQSISAAKSLITGIHNSGDAVKAGEAVVQHLPDLINAVLAGTPHDTTGQAAAAVAAPVFNPQPADAGAVNDAAG